MVLSQLCIIMYLSCQQADAEKSIIVDRAFTSITDPIPIPVPIFLFIFLFLFLYGFITMFGVFQDHELLLVSQYVLFTQSPTQGDISNFRTHIYIARSKYFNA